jgi:RNA polymerase sigma factor FliA
MNEELLEDKRHLQSIAKRAYSSAGRSQSMQLEAENDLVQKYLPLVHKIAGKVVTYMKPPLSFEDMVSAGTVGLVLAARDFDPSFGAEFQTYAYIRIKGAIIDEIRGWSFTGANLSKRLQTVRSVSINMTQETGRAPTDEELSEELGISTDELYELFDADRVEHFTSLDGFGEESASTDGFMPVARTATPDEQAEHAELTFELARAIQQLPEKSRHVILLYYQKHLTMKQIAEVLEITESRVSQLHASALFNMSVKLRQWKDGL